MFRIIFHRISLSTNIGWFLLTQKINWITGKSYFILNILHYLMSGNTFYNTNENRKKHSLFSILTLKGFLLKFQLWITLISLIILHHRRRLSMESWVLMLWQNTYEKQQGGMVHNGTTRNLEFVVSVSVWYRCIATNLRQDSLIPCMDLSFWCKGTDQINLYG